MERTPASKPLNLRLAPDPPKPNRNIHPDLPDPANLGWLLIGPPESGKTTTMLNLMIEYQHEFDLFYLISPTIGHDAGDKLEFYKLIKNKNIFGENKKLQLVNVKDVPKLIDHIESFYEPETTIYDGPSYIFRSSKRQSGKPRKRLLPKAMVMVDDLTSHPQLWNEEGRLTNLVYNRRHVQAGVIFCLHNWTSCPKKIRHNLNMISLYGALGEDFVKTFVREMVNKNVKELIETLGKGEKHDFFTFRLSDGVFYKELTKIPLISNTKEK